MMTCKVCRHSERNQVDLLLMAGEPLRSIAERFNLSKSSLVRHKDKCVPEDLSLVCQEKVMEGHLLVTQTLEKVIQSISKGLDATDRNGNPDNKLRLKAAELALHILLPPRQ
jgi:hypothetical protein